MTTERILMSSPDIGEMEESFVVRAIRSGWIAPLGPDVDAFERELATRVGVQHGVALSSGTAALHLGLLCLGVGKGDIVITSTLTFAATANAIVYTGATPYFVDCDRATGNMDPELLEEALVELRRSGHSVAAVVPVDLLGKAADYSRLIPIAEAFGVPVLSDAAESIGATHAGRAAGSFGRASAVSFNGNKIMTTSGGGMLLTNESELAAHARYLATQARQPVAHYEHTDIGYNYRMSNLLAALGRAQLTRLSSMIERRKAIRGRYKRLFGDVAGAGIFGAENDEHDNAWLTSVVVDSGTTGWAGAELGEYLQNANIESRPLWKPMHLQPVFEGVPGTINGAAENVFRSGITLPSGSALTDAQVERVCEEIGAFLEDR